MDSPTPNSEASCGPCTGECAQVCEMPAEELGLAVRFSTSWERLAGIPGVPVWGLKRAGAGGGVAWSSKTTCQN